MRIIITALALFGLIISFQNCGQNALVQNSGFNAVSGVQGSTSGTTDALKNIDEDTSKLPTMTHLEVVLDPLQISSVSGSLTASESNLDSAADRRVLLNIDSGVMMVEDQNGFLKNRFCLQDSEKSELQTIVRGAQLCHVVKEDPERMCTMVMKLAYASLYNSSERLPLGQASDGCGTGAKVLCGANDEMLRNFVSFIKANYSKRPCAQ